MFANTLTLTIDTIPYSLLRRNQDNNGSLYEYKDDVRRITMKIRHSTDGSGSALANRHNVFVEHLVYPTPTNLERYWSTTITLRDREGSGPSGLLKLWQGVSTLVLTLDDTLVAGDN